MKGRHFASLIAVGVLANVGTGQAATDTCQAELTKRTILFRAAVVASYQKCLDTIRTEIAKNAKKAGSGFLVKGAAACETALNKVFDIDTHEPAKSQRDKFYSAVNAAFAGANPKCTATDLVTLNHMLSPAQAPGTNPQDFTKVWLAVEAARSAFNDTILEQPDALNIIQAAIEAPAISPGTTTDKMRTNCTLPLNCDPTTTIPALGCRPNLCQMTKIQCRTHSCTLDNTGPPPGASSMGLHLGPIFPSVVNLTQIGRSDLEICQLEKFGYGLGNAGEGVLIMGSPSRTTGSVLVLGNDICFDSVSAKGFCAGSGGAGSTAFTGHAKDYTFCQDRLPPDTCAGTSVNFGESNLSECLCAAGPTPDPGNRCGATHPRCPVGETCGVTANGSPCYPGTHVGPVKLSNAGTSTAAGDCILFKSTQLTTLGAGQKGADATACTNDDTAPPSAVMTFPMTTGTAKADLLDASLGVMGMCSTNSNHSCIENINCTTTSGPDTCTGPSPALGTVTSGPLTGTALASVLNVETSNLSGLKLVGAFPTAGVSIGDVTTDLTLRCQ